MRFLLVLFLVIGAARQTSFSQEQDNLRLQQQLLLSREKQAEIAEQEARIVKLKLQEKRFEGQKRQLLELQVVRKDLELKDQQDSLNALNLHAKYREAVKDKFILNQEMNIRQSRRWVIYLSTVSLVVLSAAVFIFIIQRRTRKLHARISEQHDELVELGGVKDRLLTIVGHDMRSPVNMLLGLSQVLQNEDVSVGTMKKYMSQLESILHHTSSMMDNLLYWASTQMQGYRAMMIEVDLSEITKDMIMLLETQASRKGVTVVNQVRSGQRVFCDYDMMSLVIRNLLGNAIKFTPAGGSIVVSCAINSENAIICVRDNGVGMNTEQIAHFNSTAITGVESTRGTNDEKGAGLGLMLCKSFVRLMKGQISASPNVGQSGNTFQIKLKHV